jgi:hypothetical protein
MLRLRTNGISVPRNTKRSKPETTPVICDLIRETNLSTVSFLVDGLGEITGLPEVVYPTIDSGSTANVMAVEEGNQSVVAGAFGIL